MVNSKATEIFEINIDKNLNGKDHVSNNISANSFRQSDDYGIKNLPKIFPFKPSNISNPVDESAYKRFDRSSLKNYNSKLSRSKLKAVIRTSTLLCGFALVAMIELELDYQEILESIGKNKEDSRNEIVEAIPEFSLVIFGFITCLLISVHIIALMISTCILPELEALSYEDFEIEPSNQDSINEENYQLPQNFFVKKIDAFDTAHFNFPYQQFHKYIETAWICSTFLGLFLFILELGIIAFIKLYPITKIGTYIGGAILIPILSLFIILSLIFYKYFENFKTKASSGVNSKLETNEFII